jgi:hypothetical protein
MKRFVKKFLIITFFTSFFSQEIFAQSIRFTSFDDRPTCESSKGIWREFGNNCTDGCYQKLDQFAVCGESITYGCDCGKGRCWDGDQCTLLKDYKKAFDKEQEANLEKIEEEKKKRHAEAKLNEQMMMQKFATQLAGGAQQNNAVDFFGSAADTKSDQSFSGNNLAEFYKTAPNQPQAAAPQAPVITAVTQAPTPTPPVVQQPIATQPTVTDVTGQQANTNVPPLFLQQEQAKQAAANANAPGGIAVPTNMVPSQNSNGAMTPPKSDSIKSLKAIDPLSGSVPPGLPEVPLPK